MRKGQTTETLVQLRPGRRRSRNSHSLPASEGHFISMSCSVHCLRRQVLRRITAAVDTIKLILYPDNRKAVTAKTVIRRLNYSLANRRGDGCINSVTALLQNLQAGLRCQWLRGADHTASAINYATARSVRILLSVELHLHNYHSINDD